MNSINFYRMPFSFIEIEQKKTRVIGLLFVFIIFFYFITAYLVMLVLENTVLPSFSVYSSSGFRFPDSQHTLMALAIALGIGFLHWTMSTSSLIERISGAIGATTIDEKDAYHQLLKNIVGEVSVAIGGRPLEALVIPSASMNAFALEDFNKRAVIGVTEGLLARLSRAQIEAVVGHEAGHIVSGDCMGTTVTCALAEIYEATLSKIGSGLKQTRGRGSLPLLLLYLVIGFMNFMSKLTRYFISRQREYRADAISVRLTRDPLSLAEALKLISGGWRGAGSHMERLQSIFIVNPAMDSLDEQEGMFADIFSTHPPIRKRIGILVDMAHLDEKTLEENLKNFKRVSPVAVPEFKVEESPQKKDERSEFLCPHCKTPLEDISYEGTPLEKCSYCGGVFAEYEKVSRILIRRDMEFSESTVRLAKLLMKEQENFTSGLKRAKPQSLWILDCPKCGTKYKMHRQFFVYSYPVEIDRCSFCGGIWFDQQELELLQYIYEHKEEFFDGKNF